MYRMGNPEYPGPTNMADPIEPLFKRYYDQVCRFFHRMGVSPGEAEDLAQDTFISIYKGWKEISDEQHVRRRLFKAALHVGLGARIRQLAKKRVAAVVSLDGQDADPALL